MKAMKLEVVVVDWNDQPAVLGDKHFKLDVKDHGEIILELERYFSPFSIDFVYTSTDVAVPTMSKICEKFSLNFLSYDKALNCLSKNKMCQLWQKAGLLNREHYLVQNSDQLFSFFENQKSKHEDASNCKYIIKPNQASSSRGVSVFTLNQFREFDDFLALFEKTVAESLDQQAVIEEFINGFECTVEMLGDGIGNVWTYAISRKYHTDFAGKNKIAVKLHYNSLPVELQRKISLFSQDCYRALNLEKCFGHLEIMVREDGLFSPLEIGARSSGFIASSLVDKVAGRDYLLDFYEILHGNNFQKNGIFLSEISDSSSMYFFYDLMPGKPIKCKEDFKKYLPLGVTSLYSDDSRIQKGAVFSEIGSDNHRIGYEILVGEKQELTYEAIEKSERSFFQAIFDFSI